MVVPHGHLRIVVRNDADFPHGCRGTSAWADADSAWADADFAQADTDFCVGGCGSSVRVPRKFRTGGCRFRAGGRGFSVRAGADLLCGFGLKMAETRRRTSCVTAG